MTKIVSIMWRFLLGLTLFQLPACNTMQSANQYEITVLPITRNLPAEGPASLIVSLTYNGKDKVTILGRNDDFFSISFQSPSSWLIKEKKRNDELTGIQSEFKLTAGQNAKQTIHLHDFFSKITPGEVELPVTISFWIKINDEYKIVSQSLTCRFTVLEPDESNFLLRLQKTDEKLKTLQEAEERLVIYQGLSALEHPQLIPIFIGALKDNEVLLFHRIARIRLIELTEQYGDRELLIKHLSCCGTRYDSHFFQLWNEKGIYLSAIEIEQLSQSNSPWVQILCLENYPGPYNRSGIVESLKTELLELSNRINKIE